VSAITQQLMSYGGVGGGLDPASMPGGSLGVLSNSNRTITYTIPDGSGSTTHVDSINMHSTGKWYFEVLVGSVKPANGQFIIGVIPATCSDSLGVKIGNAAGTGAVYRDDGNALYEGNLVGGAGTFTTGDVIGFAWDAANGKFWAAKNNTYVFSGNPAAGTNPIATDATISGVDCQASIGIDTSNNTGLTYGMDGTIRLVASAQTYSPPAGFSAWD
jgi:hypothetical protein